MENFLNTIFITGISGFLTAFAGMFVGVTSSAFVQKKGKRFKGTALGLLGGITLGVVCFDLLPESFEASGAKTAMAGFIIGLFFAVILDGKLDHGNITSMDMGGTNFFKAAIFMAIGIGIHNFPSGVALGSLITVGPIKGLHLVIALILHGIPEGLTLGIFLRECNAGKLKLMIVAFCTSLPMGLGSALGYVLESSFAICLSLAFAAAMILYVTLRETFPAANNTWGGRLTTIGNILGLIMGMLLVSFF